MEDKILDELEDLEEATLDLLAEAYSFSKSFLQGLSTKSENLINITFSLVVP